MPVASLVCGILALILSFIPCIGWFLALILAVLGIVFGGVGITQANKSGGEGKGMSTAGLVLSILALVWIAVFLLVLGGVMRPAQQ